MGSTTSVTGSKMSNHKQVSLKQVACQELVCESAAKTALGFVLPKTALRTNDSVLPSSERGELMDLNASLQNLHRLIQRDAPEAERYLRRHSLLHQRKLVSQELDGETCLSLASYHESSDLITYIMKHVWKH